jgi:hypothetical protein
MVKHFIRVGYDRADQFYSFCMRHNIVYKYISTGFGGNHARTTLYAVNINEEDKLALRLAMQLHITETQ